MTPTEENIPQPVDQKYPQDLHGKSTHNPHGCSPSDQQATSVTVDSMTEPPFDYQPGSNLAYGMPASWEDCELLGIDPLTGDTVDCPQCHDYITPDFVCSGCGRTDT